VIHGLSKNDSHDACSCQLGGGWAVRHQRDHPRTADGQRNFSLPSSGEARESAGNQLAAFCNELAEQLYVLVINPVDWVGVHRVSRALWALFCVGIKPASIATVAAVISVATIH